MRFIDVGIFLCAILKEPKEHFEGCVTLLERLGPKRKSDSKEKVATTFLTPPVLYFILDNREKISKEKLTAAIKAINSFNIRMIPIKGEKLLMEEAAVVAEKYGIDFDDAVNVLVMRENNIKEIYALDKDYDKVEWVKRLVPE